MCQLSFVNLGDNALNTEMFLLLGTLGSTVHKDGWGLYSGEKQWKCDLPMFYTENSGKILRESVAKVPSPFMGHIRQASPLVPVITQNSHPFYIDGVIFQHNGKLTPKNPDDFILEEDWEEIDEKTKKSVTKKVKRSDSLVFFEKFMEFYKEFDGNVVTSLQETMKLFSGKFAFMISANGKFYIVKGKTADLYISYLVDSYGEEGKVLGYVVNTSKDVLGMCVNLFSNLQQLRGNPSLKFTMPEELDDETIYLAEESKLTTLGELKESYTPYTSNTTNFWKGNGWGDSWGDDDDDEVSFVNPKIPAPKSRVDVNKNANSIKLKLYEGVWEFMHRFSLTIYDIQYILYVGYGISILEMTPEILNHFVKKVIPNLASLTTKKTRKAVAKYSGGASSTIYSITNFNNGDDLQFPWMVNIASEQGRYLAYLMEKDRRLNEK